jgi:hypothetical protein
MDGDILKLVATGHPKDEPAIRNSHTPLPLDDIVVLVQAQILDRVLSSVGLRELGLAGLCAAIDIEFAN